MPRYVSTLRAVYDAKDDVEAILIAHQIRVNGAVDLDEDEGDVLDVTQTTSNSLELTPDELLTQLRVSRNLLIKTRIKECFNQARDLDQLIYTLKNREEPGFSISGYSYADFMDLAQSILIDKEQPDVG